MVLGTVGYYFVAPYRVGTVLETQTERMTLASVSTVTFRTTVSESVTSVESQTEYLLSPLNTSLTLVPTVAHAGEMVMLTGDGLPPDELLYLTDCSNGANYTHFTTDATGAVPFGLVFDFPHIPNPGSETGALVTWQIDDMGSCGRGSNPIGLVKFLYGATMTLSSPEGSAGSTIRVSADGLAAGGEYDVVFNYTQRSANPSAYGGTVVGVIVADRSGDGTTNMTIPGSADAGYYYIGLVSTHNIGTMNPANATALSAIPVFTIAVAGFPGSLGA
ncbi:MAG TPA: hypothetical protein VEC02_00690 [Nitrososphaerales archaeon]|nr:hypothetical protein [Nitrososphaerales archaeon]